ncbi:hypothetical protein G7054_g759 [Neopestalotiopsis clavispora]|nr:hypothetical protein G7054_g759 [Neopestalotiopsis clavispora]
MSWTHRSLRVAKLLYILGHGIIGYTAGIAISNALMAWLGLDECIKNMSPDTARGVKLSSSTISYSSRNVVITPPRRLILAIGPADSIILPYLSRDELSNYTNHHPISGFTCRIHVAESCPQPSALLDLSAETGQLHHAGQQVIMAEEEQGHLTLTVPPGTISTTYQVIYGMLEWHGDGFEGKQLHFCRDALGRVFAHVGQAACLPIFITVSEGETVPTPEVEE